MEEYFSFHKLTPLENMMSNIIAEGHEEVLKSFESIKNPLERCEKRKLYHQAINKLRKDK